MGLRSGLFVPALLGVLLPRSEAPAALTASAVVSWRQQNFYTYHYSITLRDTGTTPIGTFWYAWTPGQDYLPSMPTAIFSPTGWLYSVESGYDGDSIEWIADSPLQSGQNLSGFDFETSDPPGTINGPSTIFPGVPVGTSFVYSGGPFSDAGYTFHVVPVPEPVTALALGPLLLVTIARKRREHR